MMETKILTLENKAETLALQKALKRYQEHCYTPAARSSSAHVELAGLVLDEFIQNVNRACIDVLTDFEDIRTEIKVAYTHWVAFMIADDGRSSIAWLKPAELKDPAEENVLGKLRQLFNED